MIPEPTTTGPSTADYKAAQARARALGLRLSWGVDNVYRLFRQGSRTPHNSRDDWPGLLALLDTMEAARLRALAEKAETLGAAIDWGRTSESHVTLTPPQGYQQTALRCDAGGACDTRGRVGGK